LFVLSASACAAQMTPVFLSHVLVVVDQASYEGIRHSKELGMLAKVDERTVEPSCGGWTACYIAGRQTTLEILAAGQSMEEEPLRVGRSGIGFGYSGEAGARDIERRLSFAFGNRVTLRTLAKQTLRSSFPWYSEIDVESGADRVLSTWFYELSPGFLIARYPEANGAHVLEHQQYFAAHTLPNQLLDDIVGVTLALNPAETSLLAAGLKAVGWTVCPLTDKTVVNGPGITISLIPSSGRDGIQEVEFRLKRSNPNEDIRIGKIELKLAGETGFLKLQ